MAFHPLPTRCYDFALANAPAKGVLGRDMGMCGTAGALLLLRWGDATHAAADWRRCAALWCALRATSYSRTTARPIGCSPAATSAATARSASSTSSRGR